MGSFSYATTFKCSLRFEQQKSPSANYRGAFDIKWCYQDYSHYFAVLVIGGRGLTKNKSSTLFERMGFVLYPPPYTNELVTELV
jgi:hypothetical protein